MKMYALILLLGILIAGCAKNTNVQGNDTILTNDTIVMNDSYDNQTGPVGLTQVTLAELATHDSEDDCWVGYEGKAYDITDFVPRHPGGAARIIPYCGTASQFEDAFTAQHGTQQVARMMREAQYIGEII